MKTYDANLVAAAAAARFKNAFDVELGTTNTKVKFVIVPIDIAMMFSLLIPLPDFTSVIVYQTPD